MKTFNYSDNKAQISLENNELSYTVIKLGNSKEKIFSILLKDIRSIELIQPKQYLGWNILIGVFTLFEGFPSFTGKHKLFTGNKIITFSSLSKSELTNLNEFLTYYNKSKRTKGEK